MVAGLEEITEGEIRIGDEVVNDVAAARPRRRDGLPELRALPAHDGLRQPRLPAQAAQARRSRRSSSACGGSRELLELEEQLERKPRAALRRPAPARGDGPRDRPRAAGVPDGRAAVEPRREAARRRCAPRSPRCTSELGVTTIYVTHDQVEAMTLGERIAVMRKGVLQQVGTPQRALRPPGQHLRRRLHRQPGDELLPGQVDEGRRGFASQSASSGWTWTTTRAPQRRRLSDWVGRVRRSGFDRSTSRTLRSCPGARLAGDCGARAAARVAGIRVIVVHFQVEAAPAVSARPR